MTWKFRRLLPFFILLLVGAYPLAAQSRRVSDLAAGKILVAPRSDSDPLFAQSVILLVRYNQTGALGLMVNRRTKFPISRALPRLKGAAGHSDPVFVGGPVQLDAVFALVRAPSKPDSATKVFGNVYFISTKTALEKALSGTSGPSTLRIYVGYCGWAPGQLDHEVAAGGWYIFNSSADVVFNAKPASLWLRFAGAPGQKIAQLRFFPPRASKGGLQHRPVFWPLSNGSLSFPM